MPRPGVLKLTVPEAEQNRFFLLFSKRRCDGSQLEINGHNKGVGNANSFIRNPN
jgi:hypothetical protein